MGDHEHLVQDVVRLFAVLEREVDLPADHRQQLGAMLFPLLAQGGEVGNGGWLGCARHETPQDGRNYHIELITDASGDDLTEEFKIVPRPSPANVGTSARPA